MKFQSLAWLAFACSLCAPLSNAAVVLPKILGSHMVLQRQQPIHVWGWADPNEAVSAEFNGKTQKTVADSLGKWSLYLPGQEAGGPYKLTVKASNTLELEDIMLGDVWFASGQSNMEMPLQGFIGSAVIKDSEEEIRNANHPNLRLFRTPTRSSVYPLPDFDAQWTACTPETAAKFSAVAYFFGRNIAEDQNVTVGLIDSTWGGTPVEAWISMDGLSSDASLMPVFAEWGKMAAMKQDMARVIDAEKRADEEAKATGKAAPRHSWHPNPDSWQPAALYNGMVAAAVDFPIKGVIWYQGESNSLLARANLYEREFPALIQDWRTKWHEGNFPFLYVQIANYKSSPAESYNTIREAQRRSLRVANTAMAVTIDIGDPNNVHPANKQDVGLRLALAARALAYDEKVYFEGPSFRETSVEGESIRVLFDHAHPLVARGGAPKGFEVAGEDHHFYPANARIDGQTVLLTSAAVPSPKYVRYGWENAPVLNLFNARGLPASPFTSEESIPKL
jgi:sialate O-acetylesterase